HFFRASREQVADPMIEAEEIEVKFIVDDVTTLRQRIIGLEASLHHPRAYEDNWCFDTPDQRFQQEDRLLRLRRDRRILLTYKEPPPTADTAFKVRQEYEIEVNDFEQARALVEKLGFAPSLRYEKYRETFRYGEAEILLDETPLGAFVEIEGTRESIDAITKQLELDDANRITASYGDIFEAVRTAYDLPFGDMTFDNFRDLSIDLHSCQLS
ncbi:class IV adenylate cyclase, partial [Candidatus Entotheonella palauensis]|uniref:class IV adenylate cyclase n=1 Tax=Candidatus Entotheonella palauensis TaxID=93172 RepID=UPI0011781CB3